MSGQSSPAAPPYYDGQEHANGTSTSSTASPRDTSPQLHSSPASSVSSTRDTWRRPTRGRTVDSLDSLDEQDEHGPEATYSSTQPLLPRQTNGSSSPSSPLFPRRTSNEYPGNAGSERTDSPLSRPDDSSAEVIGFHPVDPMTKLDLVDPVLCSDGLMHDRWSIILSGKPYKHSILGEVKQLREAIFAMWPERKEEYHLRRENFKRETLEGCAATTGHDALPHLLWQLDHVLLWEPKSTSLLIRRGVVRYRMRELQGCLEDFTKAIDLSRKYGSSDLVDALCYRALAREACNDRLAAMVDVEEALSRSQRAIGFAIRASLKASLSDMQQAMEDLHSFEMVLSASEAESEIAGENKDLEMLASGWARSAVGHIPEALDSFERACQHRLSPDPYILASLGLAQILVGQTTEGRLTLDTAIDQAQNYARLIHLASSSKSSTRPTSVANLAIPFDLFLLRGMSYYVQGAHHEALNDFERGISLRPACVKDTGELRYVLACLRAETGDVEQARADFLWAVALKPDQRDVYEAERDRMLPPGG